MRNPPAFGGIGYSHRRFKDGNSPPSRPNEDFHLELKATGPHIQSKRLRQWIDAHPALGVGKDRSPGGADPEIGKLPAEATCPGNIGAGHPFPSADDDGTEPRGNARIRPGTSRGSCCPSASSVTAQSAVPWRAEKPVRIAAPLPRFLSWRSTVIPEIRWRHSVVPSVEPSSMTQIGNDRQRARSMTERIPSAWL
jgi:hypothetical protein